jgi:hypothetical protein
VICPIVIDGEFTALHNILVYLILRIVLFVDIIVVIYFYYFLDHGFIFGLDIHLHASPRVIIS